VVIAREQTAEMVEIFIELTYQLQNGIDSVFNKVLKFSNPGFLGIRVCVASVPVGFKDAEITQRIGKTEKIMSSMAMNNRMPTLTLCCTLTDDR
jgi:hypothetical protein